MREEIFEKATTGTATAQCFHCLRLRETWQACSGEGVRGNFPSRKRSLYTKTSWTFEEQTLVSGYADNLALATSSHIKEEATQRMPEEANKVVAWSMENRFTLNTGKCETCLITPSKAEHKRKRDIRIKGQPIQDTQQPNSLVSRTIKW